MDNTAEVVDVGTAESKVMRPAVLDAYEPEGIHFVPLSQHPLEIINVVDVKKAAAEFYPEIEWAIEAVKKYHGYGIALPQLGIPVNIAVLRFNREVEPSVVCNIGYFPDKSKPVVGSKEADYSLGCSLVFFTVSRWKKIKAQWMNSEGEMYTKVLKIPKKAFSIPASVIVQNVSDHMLPNYPQRLRKLLERRLTSNPDALGAFIEEMPEKSDDQ